MENESIKDYSLYNQRMGTTLFDKLFFIDKIEPDLIVDFGCADGLLLRTIQSVKSTSLIGYDIDPNMAELSKDLTIYSKWNQVINHINVNGYTSVAVNLSSVLHEVFHYGSKSDIDTFWNQIFDSNIKYIVIRDMIPGGSIVRPSSVNDIRKVYHKYLGHKALNDFERIWGSIEDNKQLIHFLLKYKYLTPNWEREVKENYLPITRETLLSKIPLDYDIVYHEHYVLPYLYRNVKSEFGIEIKDNTHLKLILERV